MPDNPHLSSPHPDRDVALLAFFLGPVQPFIAGARTVRDLWTGSYLLAWLTFAAIRKARDSGVSLLSPRLSDDHPLLWYVQRKGDTPESITTPCIPNRFIASVPVGIHAHMLAEQCEIACQDEWARICVAVHKQIGAKIKENAGAFSISVKGRQINLLAGPWDRFWDAQVQSFFEVRTAVVFPTALTQELRSALLNPVPKTERQAAMDILFGMMDARKSVRHVPNYEAQGDVPQKCTLLGTYEQLGPAPLDESRTFWEVFAKFVRLEGTRIRKGERLCAVSLVKRFAWPACFAPEFGLSANQLRYSDTATVAAKRWLPADEKKQSPALDPELLRDEYGNWNGQWLHWPTPHFDEEEKRCPGDIWGMIREKRRRQGNPPTYYAILMADADKLGDKIAAKGEKVSAALTTFALQIVRGIIESDMYRGELIYSGGDDTLALLPTETALACARAVQREYVENWTKHFPGENDATISAGLAVVHYKEDLRFALDVAREAERAAKHCGRNALALAVCRRSGEHTSAVVAWKQAGDLQALVEAFCTDVSDRWTYKLRALLPTFRGMPWDSFKAELRRLLRRIEGVTKATRMAFETQVMTFADNYFSENRQRCPADKPPEADGHVMSDFVTLCQSASFLARGRDA